MGASTSALLTLDAMGYPGHIKAHSQSYEAVRRPKGKPFESFGGLGQPVPQEQWRDRPMAFGRCGGASIRARKCLLCDDDPGVPAGGSSLLPEL